MDKGNGSRSQTPQEHTMQSQQGYYGGFRAVRYSNGKVFYNVGGHWFQAIGHEDQFTSR